MIEECDVTDEQSIDVRQSGSILSQPMHNHLIDHGGKTRKRVKLTMIGFCGKVEEKRHENRQCCLECGHATVPECEH